MTDKLDKLEALRGAAALYVVLHHTVPHSIQVFNLPLGHLLRFGQEAVILFFLLSGFVINYSFRLSKNHDFSSYFTKRFCRIYIPLVVVMLISFITESYEAGGYIGPDITTLVANLFMLQDWAMAYPNVIADPYMGNGPLWSLSYEWWFYMLFFPITMYTANSVVANRLVFSLAIVSAVLYVFYPVFILRVMMHLAIWWAGAYVGALYLENKHREFKALLPVCGVLGLISFILTINVIYYLHSTGAELTFVGHPLNELRHFVFALIAIVGGWVWLRSGWIFYRFTVHHFRIFAPVSFAMYICHDPIMRDATYLSFIDNPVWRWVGYFLVMLLVSYLIEIVLYPKIRRRIQPLVQALISRDPVASRMTTGTHSVR